ncbi:LINE-1 retrotransposable element ORF2 protein [Portunus trituberculatus]|uniref:LINE-1 retrotransposable element ORF2 protein n=1 Tax=Portunus trituberculatus TaxID=210409 RepID=A0A5B7K6W3_PORTR|nr:LINE-1 retrotransposable element ORF2 protein [Portunus trituberculatus]
MVADPKTVADLFPEHFASVSRKDPAAPSARSRQRMEYLGVNFSSTGGESYNVPFSVSEVQTALSQCLDSSPGPDDIPYAFLRHIPDSAYTFLLNLYIMILHTGDFTSFWAVAVVLSFPMPGKDHLQATNYRPISLPSCICEIPCLILAFVATFLFLFRSFYPDVFYGFELGVFSPRLAL